MSSAGPIMLDLKGTSISSEEKEMLRHPACGGVILFARNIETPEQVTSLNQQIAAINPSLLRAVDQEGGRVQRLKQGFSELPALRELESKASHFEQAEHRAYHHARVMALETLSVGFDISFSPVLDIATTSSRVIGDRAFHEQPDSIVALASAYIKGMKECGMAATGKHFPGHGSVDADSHIELPVDERDWQTIKDTDLKSFSQLSSELGGIMPAHVIYSQLDKLPAGFSPFWVAKVLREQMGFNGVVFSDDISMKGAETVGDFDDRVSAALDAGCDMVLVCNHPTEAGDALEHVMQHHQSSPSKSQIKTSAARIQSMKASDKNLCLYRDLKQDTRWQTSHSVLFGN